MIASNVVIREQLADPKPALFRSPRKRLDRVVRVVALRTGMLDQIACHESGLGAVVADQVSELTGSLLGGDDELTAKSVSRAAASEPSATSA
jgi:hypothetical protein